MVCRNASKGSTAILWFSIIGVLAAAASIIYNWLMVDKQYANSPADAWALVGGVTSSTVSFRIRLASEGIPLPSSGQNTLIIGKRMTSERVVELPLTSEYQTLSSSMLDYGLYAVEVAGLEPQTQYLYSVQITDPNLPNSYTTDLQGTFQTPAPEGTQFSFKIAAGACAWTGSRSDVFKSIRQSQPDLQLFLHVGDFHYEDLDTSDMNKRLDAVSTVLKSAEQADMYGSLPLAYIWDDHDYLGNQEPGQTSTAISRKTALLSYQLAFPHYPLAAAAAVQTTATNDTADTKVASPIPVYQAFTIGTVRFIVTDLLSESNGTSIYSTQQRDWFFSELGQADQYDYVVWASSKPWIGSQTANNEDSVYGSWIATEFEQDRFELSNYITDVLGGVDGPQNLIFVGGDAHMMAFDDGTNSYFGEEALDGSSIVNSFPILQSAPLDRFGSVKGGPYSGECQALLFERTHQYSTLSFEFPEEGSTSTSCLQIESFRVDPWFGQSQIFTRRICGPMFRPAQTPADSKDSCTIDVLSTTNLAFYTTTMVLCLIVGCATCFISLRDPKLGRCGKVGCGISGTFVACFFALLTISAGSAMYFRAGIAQIDTRISFVTDVVMLLLMLFALFIIGCRCFRHSPTDEQEDEKDQSDPENSRVSAATAASNMWKPSVVRQETASIASEDQLPEGIILTGGEELRKEGLTGTGVRVAVIDSGVDIEHPGFNGKVTKQVWLRSGTPLEEDDHGTHVAGTVHLMAPEAEIHDYRVFGKEGALGVDRAIAKAIIEATDGGCQVINMSLGGPVPNDTIWDSVQYANSKGVLLVCAAGNEGDNNPLTNEISYPAYYKECTSIAAVSKRNGFPVAVFSNSNSLVDYAGIGVDVVSFKPGGGYQSMSGTSMACPHVAGLIACLLTNQDSPPSSIGFLLNDLAIDIDALGVDDSTGVGFVTYLNESTFDAILPRLTARSSVTPALVRA